MKQFFNCTNKLVYGVFKICKYMDNQKEKFVHSIKIGNKEDLFINHLTKLMSFTFSHTYKFNYKILEGQN